MWGAIASAIGAVVGGTISAVDNNNSIDKQLSDYKRAMEQLTKEYELNKENAQLQYDKAKDTAFKNAARVDAKSDMDEDNVGREANLALGALQLQQEAEGLGWNQQAQQNDQSKGAALSDIAASGIRSGSIQDAVEMQAAQNSQMLDISEKQQRSGDQLQLANILQNLNEGKFGIQSNRTDAQQLRDDYAEGGYNDQIFKNELAKLKSSYEYSYDTNKRNRDYIQDNRVLMNMAAFFGGASTGASIASNLYDISSNLAGSLKSTIDYKKGSSWKNGGYSAFSNGYKNVTANSAYYQNGYHW